MEYRFKGHLEFGDRRKARFEIIDGRIFFPISDMPSFALAKKNQVFSGATDDGRHIEILIDRLFHVGYFRGLYVEGDVISVPHIEGFVGACSVYEDVVAKPIDSICFYSLEIPKVTNRQISGAFTSKMAEVIGLEENLGSFRSKDGHRYDVSIGFLTKEPHYQGQSLAIKADSDFTLGMMAESYWVTRRLLSFLYQKRFVPLEGVYLMSGGKKAGRLFVETSKSPEGFSMRTKCIPISDWGNKLSALLQTIADGKLYLRHLPVFKEEERSITSGRFLMALVGLESTLDRLGIHVEHSKKHIEAKSGVRGAIQKLAGEAHGKEKEIYRQILKSISNDNDENFEQRIAMAISENAKQISNFFALESLGPDEKAVAKELARVRNKFAHGDLDVDLTLESAEQMHFLTLLILYLQLLSVGFSKDEASMIVPEILFSH